MRDEGYAVISINPTGSEGYGDCECEYITRSLSGSLLTGC